MNKNFRSCNLRLKNIDTNKKEVLFYYLTFNNKNDYGEVFHKGCTLRTIRENFDNIKYFKNHEIEHPCGVVLELGEDEIGAWAKCKLIDNETGKDTFIEYAEKQITQHSFGFDYVFEAIRYDEQTDTLHIYDLDLWEVSALNGWGADKNTKVIQFNNKTFERAEFVGSLKGGIKTQTNFTEIINKLKFN